MLIYIHILSSNHLNEHRWSKNIENISEDFNMLRSCDKIELPYEYETRKRKQKQQQDFFLKWAEISVLEKDTDSVYQITT